MTSADHNLGLRGQFAVPPELQETAQARGLRIENIGGGRYRVEAANSESLRNMAPDFAACADEFDAKKLRRFLGFLHQPLGLSTQTHESRVLAHRMLRFATTGSVRIPGDDANTPHHKHLEDDEHVDVENAIKAGDLWRTKREFEIIDWNGELPAELPCSGFDREQGVYFFYPAESDLRQSPAQQEVQHLFRDFVRAATSGRATGTDQKICLTGAEIEKFCAQIESNAEKLEPIFARAEYDELVQNALANVRIRKENMLRQALEKATEKPSRFKTILKTTSSYIAAHLGLNIDSKLGVKTACENNQAFANFRDVAAQLKPVIESDAAKKSWSRYHFFERNDSPIPAMIMELGILQEVLNNAAPEDMPAIAQEFGPLFSFARSLFKHMEESAQKKHVPLGPDFMVAQAASQSFPRKIENSKYRELASTMRKGLELDGAIKQTWDVGWNSVKGFGGDMWNFFREKPGMFVAATLVAAYLYHAGTGTQMSPELAKMIREIPPNSIMIPGPEGLMAVPFDVSTLPEWARAKQNWHLDGDMVKWVLNLMRGEWNPVGTFKHYTFDIFVSDPAKALMSYIDQGSQALYSMAGGAFDAAHQFAETAPKTVAEIVDKLFGFNVLQGGTHSGWWIFNGGKGLTLGLVGGMQIVKLMAPAGNMLAAAGMKTAEKIQIKENPDLAGGLMACAKDEGGTVPEKTLSAKAKHFLKNKWTLAATGTVAASALLVCAGNPDTAVPTAHTAAALGSGAIFAVYNFYDDIFLNHIVGGATLLLSGAGLRAVYQKAVGPVARWAHESIQEKSKDLQLFGNNPISLNLSAPAASS